MSMLAEPRQKKRYNLVPRGKALYEDKNRFGVRMLEQMGWSKDKGLGAHEDGKKDFVRIRYKNDIEGFGYIDRDDQWTEHGKQFTELLQSLNNSVANSDDEEEIREETELRTGFGFMCDNKNSNNKTKSKISPISLEEQSKNSKVRVHYKKFTRGKDLTNCSEKDLANIFGKKSLSDDQEFLNFQPLKVEHQNVAKYSDDNCDQKYGIKTVIMATSVKDYFKQKMENFKLKKIDSDLSNCKNNQETSVTGDFQNESKEKKKNKKSKKQKKNKVRDIEADNIEMTVNRNSKNELMLDDFVITKNHKQTFEEILNSNESTNLIISTEKAENEETIVEKKTKKSKRKRNNSEIELEKEKNDNAANYDGNECSKEIFSVIKKKKKKDKHTGECDNPIEEINTNKKQVSDVFLSKKSKKLKVADILQEHVVNPTDPEKVRQEETNELHSKTQNQTGQNLSNLLTNEQPDKIRNKYETEAKVNVVTDYKNESIDDYGKNDDPNCYTITGFTAEIFRHADLKGFLGSNIGEISGYGVDQPIKLLVKHDKMDSENIMRLWQNMTVEKDQLIEKNHETPIYKYHRKVDEARKSMKKVPKMNIKQFKRKSIFTYNIL